MLSILLVLKTGGTYENEKNKSSGAGTCLLYTSDAADEL